jgi:hypothetical protein
MMPKWPAGLWLVALLTVGPLAGEAAAQNGLAVGGHDRQQGADVLGAFADSLKLLLIEHGTRLGLQEKTRRELDAGSFWSDYRRSVRMPRQWADTDSGLINYVGHPIHGAAAGYIWLDHEPGALSDLRFTSEYWASRMRAFAFSASYSLQFEIGPLSEASIGNVGMRPETTGWVDYVITPVGALGLIVAEDALDRYLVQWAERRVKNPLLRIGIRFAANPGRTMANTASGRVPWHRDGRPINWRD